MGGVKVGELYGELRLDKRRFDPAMKSAGASFMGLGKMAGQLIAKLALVAAAAVAAFPLYAVKTAMDFETAMLNVNSIAKVDTETFDRMKASVIAMSTELPQTAETLAKGLYDIASSGFAGEEGLTVLNAAAKAASAGLTTTEVSAAGVVGVLNAYGLKAEDAARVSDIMFKTVDRGVITFEELSGEIGKTTALAAPLGVSIEEVAAGIALMTRKSIDGANATTQLNAIMTNLLKPSQEAAALADDLGLGWDAAALKARGLTGVLADMVVATGGNHEQMATLLGDARAIRGAFVLASDGGAQFNAELAIMEGAAGATDTALSYQKQGLAYNLQLTKNKIDAAAIVIGTKLMPKIAEIASRVADWVDKNQELIGQVGGALLAALEAIVGAIGLLIEGVKLVVSNTPLLIAILAGVATIIWTMVIPAFIAWAAAAAAAAIASVIALAPVYLAILAIVGAVALAAMAINNFAMDFGEMGDRLHEVERETGASYDAVKELTKRFMSDMGLSFEEAADAAERELRRMPDMTKKEMGKVVEAAKRKGAELGGVARLIGIGFIDKQFQAMKDGYDPVKAAADNVMSALPDAVEDATEEAVEIAHLAPGAIAGALMDEDELADAAKELKERILNPFVDMKRRAQIEAQLASKWIAEGLRSDDSKVVDDTIAYVNDLMSQYETMEPGAMAAGELVNPALLSGVRSNIDLTVDAMKDIAARIGKPMDFSSDANVYGYNSMDAYFDGMARAARAREGELRHRLFIMSKMLRADSPPGPESPLHKIDVWGERTMAAYAGGIERGGASVEGAMRRALGDASMQFPALAGEAGPTLARQAPAGRLDDGAPVSVTIEKIEISGVGSDVSHAAARRFGQMVIDEVALGLQEQASRFASRPRVSLG
jgi:TP901 family phage tail tape measure protein